MTIRGRRLSVRLLVAVGVLVAVVAWFAAASRSLGDSLLYAYEPGDLAGRPAPQGTVRVGGQVVPGSVRWDPDRRLLRFRLRDERASIRVVQRAAPPALFRGGTGAVVEGTLRGRVLVGSNIVVRHDNTYRAPDPEASS